MRLWHHELLPYLPKQQLLGQWRELNSIYANQNKHILINFVYEYEKSDLFIYSLMVIKEMLKRKYKLNLDKFCNYFDRTHSFLFDTYIYNITSNIKTIDEEIEWRDVPFSNHMNNEYLKICCWNLYEKYLRGQEGFTDEAIEFIYKHCFDTSEEE